MTDIADPVELSLKIRRFNSQSIGSKTPKEWRCRVLHQALPLAPRVGEQFALELLNLVPEALRTEGIAFANPPTRGEIARIRGELIDRAIVLAAQYGQVEYVRKTIHQFVELIRSEPEESRFIFINYAMAQCLRNLKKLRMLDMQIDPLLAGVQQQAFPEGTKLADLRTQHGANASAWVRVLQTLLHLAGGWLMRHSARATEILDATRLELFGTWKEKFKAVDALYYTELAQAYIAALGHGPSETGIARIKEFFDIVPAGTLPNNWTGSQTYSRLHLKLVEEVIHALTSHEFALGPAGRKWLDDDEYIVRSRIHSDMTNLRERNGM